MKRSFVFLLTCLGLETWGVFIVLSGALPPWLKAYEVACLCGLTGGVGGVTYCMRGIYTNTCAGDGWNPKWMAWYFIRPVVSLICGVISYLILKAGLLVLDSSTPAESNHLGFYVLAFVAGLNVDKFLTKIEDIAQTTWGIERSRSARKDPDKAQAGDATTNRVEPQQQPKS
jgi:hypothetical protein